MQIMKYLSALFIILWITLSIAGCVNPPQGPVATAAPATTAAVPALTTSSTAARTASHKAPPTTMPAGYGFPESIDTSRRYLFYLHGKILEDQGLPAISPVFGEYEYESILEAFAGYGFVVISEQRSKNTDSVAYASRVAGQVAKLLNAGVPEANITIVGASKGAGIAIYVSHSLEGQAINYVLLAICHPDIVENLIQNKINLNGDVLSIYDSVDEYAGSCQELFAYSKGKGIERYDEIVLQVGTGHGVLYKPLDEWVLPVIQWARSN